MVVDVEGGSSETEHVGISIQVTDAVIVTGR